MAEIVGVFGTSHSPALMAPRDDWPSLEPKIVRPTQPHLVGYVRERWEEHENRCAAAMAELRTSILACRPDVLLIIGSDQGENFDAHSAPVFEFFVGEEVDASAANRRDEGVTQFRVSMPVARKFGLDLLADLCGQGFDIGQSSKATNDYGIGHAITWPLRFLDLAEAAVQLLPLVTNVWNPPNTPTVARCVELGQSIRAAIERHPAPIRVAILASGGLSHLILDEELDARVLSVMKGHDLGAWSGIADAELFQAHEQHGLPLRLNGTAEISDWIIADACADSPAEIIDYIPAYRTESGYGVGMCFAQWLLPAAALS